MAARLNRRNQESVRAKIQGSQLVNLLQNHALKDTAIAQSRLDAAKFLIGKILSNPPEQVEHAGKVEISWPK